ncbi:TPM domain-containing protein [Nostoc sp. CCY0012]|uniref:TPM domain-containing protein n=1 Tax=Nostoc sp. CCY0012 TaxID=1056123 RepID=UPI0039C62749
MKFNLLPPKRIFWLSIFSSAILSLPLSSLALTVKEVPNPRQRSGDWVTDMAGILSDEAEAQINQMIADLEAKNGTEMAVVTVPQTAPAASPKEFATELFNYWGIGKKGQDNGVLFLISVGDRRVEIETGYGVEAILPDAKVGNIIDTQIIPRFKQGDFAGGTLAGTKALVVVLTADPDQISTLPTTEVTADNPNSWGGLPIVAGGGLFAIGIGTAVYFLSHPRKIRLKPEGQTRIKQGNYSFLCADCQQPMEKVDASMVWPHLNLAENAAQNLGSVNFEGWKCLHCHQQPTDKGFHLVALTNNSSRFGYCPDCQELTVTHNKKTIKQPTRYSKGQRLIISQCNLCAYHYERKESIPRLPPPPSSGGFGGGSGSFGGGSSGGGGGSFGGGSSGGGGSGGSW